MASRKKEKPAVDEGAELIAALDQMVREKGIDREIIFETIEASLLSACKKHYGGSENMRIVMNRENGRFEVYAQKIVSEEAEDDFTQISLADAHEIDVTAGVGDMVEIAVTPKNFGYVAVQSAKQVVVQKFRELEREILYNEYASKEHQLITGIVSRKERKNYVISLGRMESWLPPSEQVRGEELRVGGRVKVYITEVRQTTKGPQVNISRSRPELVACLFKSEVPEVEDGTVEIKFISREAGSRTKMAVISHREGVDPVGACVGPNGSRVNIIVSELRGEKIDIISYNSDPEAFIAAALAPSKVVRVIISGENAARVIVPDNQLSLAIGKEGQNARLAARLTGYKVDIKSESQAKAAEMDEKLARVGFPREEAERAEDAPERDPEALAEEDYKEI
ncbi:MAG: transcription termination factor NusA [Clostridiales bacterium]|jgi:N utilization substance protein A|nr:transcription termination factor NusA [Clostridiales bacterium]